MQMAIAVIPNILNSADEKLLDCSLGVGLQVEMQSGDFQRQEFGRASGYAILKESQHQTAMFTV